MGEAFYEGGWGPFMSGLAEATARDLAEWAPKADSIAKELASRRRARDDHEWTQWCVRALSCGAGKACAFAREEAPMEATTAGAPDSGQVIFDPQAVAGLALDAWAGVWQGCGAACGRDRLQEAVQQAHPLDLASLDGAELEGLNHCASRRCAQPSSARRAGAAVWTMGPGGVQGTA